MLKISQLMIKMKMGRMKGTVFYLNYIELICVGFICFFFSKCYKLVNFFLHQIGMYLYDPNFGVLKELDYESKKRCLKEKNESIYFN